MYVYVRKEWDPGFDPSMVTPEVINRVPLPGPRYLRLELEGSNAKDDFDVVEGATIRGSFKWETNGKPWEQLGWLLLKVI